MALCIINETEDALIKNNGRLRFTVLCRKQNDYETIASKMYQIMVHHFHFHENALISDSNAVVVPIKTTKCSRQQILMDQYEAVQAALNHEIMLMDIQ